MSEETPRNVGVNIYGEGFVGEGTKVAAFVDIGGRIGKNCSIQTLVSIPPGTIIEDNVFIGPGVNIANDKYPEANNPDFVPQGTIIKRGAVIGMGAKIGPGLVIGENSLVGMGSVVIKDVEANTVVVGNPARVIGMRDPS